MSRIPTNTVAYCLITFNRPEVSIKKEYNHNSSRVLKGMVPTATCGGFTDFPVVIAAELRHFDVKAGSCDV